MGEVKNKEQVVKLELHQSRKMRKVYIDDVEIKGVRSVFVKLNAQDIPVVELSFAPSIVEVTGISDIIRKYEKLQRPPFNLDFQEQDLL